MTAHLVERITGRPVGSFARKARQLGVSSRVVRILEPSARAICPEEPEIALEFRESFETAAMHAVTKEASDLQLSYGTVDLLAGAVETLGLARASDVPDPFRRVWLADAAGARRRGVVLRCDHGEVAVFCPPSAEPFTAAGPIFTMSYRGFSSSVEYDLKLSDVVRLPKALVVHLTRPEQGGAIGRDNLRVDVRMPAALRATGEVEPLVWREWQPSTVLDISSGGLRVASDLPFGAGQEVQIEVSLPTGGEPLRLDATICWNRTDAAGERSQGLLLSELPASIANRYLGFMSGLLTREGQEAGWSLTAPVETPAKDPEPFQVIAFEEASPDVSGARPILGESTIDATPLAISALPSAYEDWDEETELAPERHREAAALADSVRRERDEREAERDELSSMLALAQTCVTSLENELKESQAHGAALELRMAEAHRDAADQSAHQAQRIDRLEAELAEALAALEETRAELSAARQGLAAHSYSIESAAELLARLRPLVAAIEGELTE